ncbi:MAG: amidohydrolase family protein [Actinomycetota bacterium]
MSLAIRAPLAWLGPGDLQRDVQIDCAHGEIIAVGAPHPVADGTELLEADGFLMAAAADRHVHIGLADPMAVLLRGVTAVRDLAWPADRIFALADASESPSFNGPLIRATGPMLTGVGGYPTEDRWAPPGTGRELRGPQDAETAVRELAGRGAAAVKVSLNAEAGPTPTDGELAAIAETAHELGLPVTAHAQGAGQVERALGAGFDELAHTPWTDRLSDDVVTTVAQGMRIVSTLDICSYGQDTPQIRTALDNLRRFHAAGGTVIYGTDLGNGAIPPGIHTRELQLLVEAGLEYEEVLEAMVRAPVAPGSPADLLVLGADPLDNLSAFDDVRAVIRGGRVMRWA